MITYKKNNYLLSRALTVLCSMLFAVMAMAQTAADLYRLLKADGKGEKDPAVLVELLPGKR